MLHLLCCPLTLMLMNLPLSSSTHVQLQYWALVDYHVFCSCPNSIKMRVNFLPFLFETCSFCSNQAFISLCLFYLSVVPVSTSLLFFRLHLWSCVHSDWPRLPSSTSA
ncbi:unnamed protein product [Calicophoron daubneyi]|uniref:Secreted protein n=1 Tax=Calicophoron daubneyi TaxID=300641 RepID=A0AAV2TX97_CALDB